MSDIYNILQKIIPTEKIKRHVSMKEYTTFKTGGEASFFLSPTTIKELVAVIEVCRSNKFPYYILGNGSNVLVKDSGFSGVIISTKHINSIELVDSQKIKAESGAILAKVANFALDNDLTGLEFASGIPGTIGGAVFMNAGAYDGEISHVFESASVLLNNGDIATFYKSDMLFSYRNSIIQSKGLVVLDAVINLEKGDYLEIKNKMLDLNKRRAEKQPLDMPSAGSAFKRPLGNYASRLIMDAGLSGFSIGGAQISEKHCGFIVNTGNATATDIINLVEHVQDVVFENFGIALELEFRIIGDAIDIN